MKMNTIFFILSLFICMMLSCKFTGKLALSNEYPYDVIIYVIYDYQGENIELRPAKIGPGGTLWPRAQKHIEYNHIISIRVESVDGLILADYPYEYILKIRNAYKEKQKKFEAWFFSEKGLFIYTSEIGKRYKHNSEKISEYYRSDEAVRDLEIVLEKAKM